MKSRKDFAGLHLGPVHSSSVELEQERGICTEAALGRYGIVRVCRALPAVAGGPDLQMWVARGVRRLRSFPDVDAVDGTGVDRDGAVARSKAVAECLERYAMALQPVGHPHVRAAFADLGADAVDPTDFALFSTDQHRRSPGLRALTDREVLDWCWGHSLADGRPKLVPSVLAHGRGGLLPADVLPELTSTGMACDVRLEPAIRAGLCEVLERDALAIAWRNRLPFTPLDPGGTEIEELLGGVLGGSGLTFSLLQVPTDLPLPVVMAVGWNAVRPPHAAVGTACRTSRVAAARKAVYEVVQMMSRSRGRAATLPERIRSFEDHASLYATREWAGILRGALGERPPCPLTDEQPGSAGRRSPEHLQELVGALARLGLDVLVVDLTTPDVAATGARVVRVIIPGAADINGDMRFPRLGGIRMYEVPLRLGLADAPAREAELRRIPIPLA